MAQHEPRPTAAEIFALLEERRSVYTIMHTEMLVDEEWIDAASTWRSSPIRPYVTGFGQNYRLKVLPYAALVVQRGVMQVYTGEAPQVTFQLPQLRKLKLQSATPQEQQRERETKERIERWLQAFLEHITTTSSESPFLDFLNQQLGLGLGTLSYCVAWDRWLRFDPPSPNEEDNYPPEHHGFPWDVVSVHPLTVFPDPYNDPPRDIIEERPVSPAEMTRRYPHLTRDGGRISGASGLASSRLVTYCSAEWYGQWWDRQPCLTADDGADEDGIAPNPTGRLWYKTAWSGFGRKDYLGRQEYRGVGLVRRSRDLFLILTKNDNILDLIKTRYGVTQYQVKGPTREQAAEETAQWMPGEPSVLALSNDVNLAPIPMPELPPALLQETLQANQLLERIHGPGVLSGEFHSEAAVAQRTRRAAAAAPYQAPKVNAEQAVASMLMDILYSLKYELSNDVTLFRKGQGITLRPEDIPDGGTVTVDFTPPSKEEKAFEVEAIKAKQQIGWYSRERAMREGGQVEDVEEEMAQQLAEQVLANPVIQQWQAQLVQQRLRPEAAGQPQPGMPPPAPQNQGGLVGPPAPPSPPPPAQLQPGQPEPSPLLGSSQEAQQQAHAAFQPPQPVGGM